MTFMISTIAYLSLTGMAVASFWFIVMPMLRQRPAFAELHLATDSFWSALWMKIESIKTKMLASLLMIATGLLAVHDVLIPAAAGLDWTPLSSKVPPIVWLFLTFTFNALFFWLRKQTETDSALKLVAVEAGVVTATQAIKGDAVTKVAVAEMPVVLVAKAEEAAKAATDVVVETAKIEKPKEGD